MRARGEVDALTYPVHCHVCPGAYSAERMGLPRGRDLHPRYVSRAIGSTHYGALWHCPEHADPELSGERSGGYKRAVCGCPFGDMTDEPPTDQQVERWAEQRRQRDEVLAGWLRGRLR